MVVPRAAVPSSAASRGTTTPIRPRSSASRQRPAASDSGEEKRERAANGRRALGGRRGALWEWRLFQDGGGGRRAGRRSLLVPGQYPSSGRGRPRRGLRPGAAPWPGQAAAWRGSGDRCGGVRDSRRVLAGQAVSWGRPVRVRSALE